MILVNLGPDARETPKLDFLSLRTLRPPVILQGLMVAPLQCSYAAMLVSWYAWQLVSARTAHEVRGYASTEKVLVAGLTPRANYLRDLP